MPKHWTDRVSPDDMAASFASPQPASPVPVAATADTTITAIIPSFVFAASGETVTLQRILEQNFGPTLGGYTDFWLAYQSAADLQANDFSYWDPSHPKVARWLVGGQDIGADTEKHVSLDQLSSVTFLAGNDIGIYAYLTVRVAPNELLQFEIATVDPSLKHFPANNAEPTAADLVDSAHRFANLYSGTPNDNDCHGMVRAMVSAVGATLPDYSYDLHPANNIEGGFWRIAYRGTNTHATANWHTLLKPGDVVRMGYEGSAAKHSFLVLSVSSDGKITAFDNAAKDIHGTEIMALHATAYDTLADPSTVTIYRLTGDHLYLTAGTNTGERLAGTLYADHILANGGNDIVTGWIGDDVLAGGLGNDHLNGNAGDDTLLGSAGRDHMAGGAGRDRLSGGFAADVMSGGSGADTFVYGNATDSTGSKCDRIVGFNARVDKFDLLTKVTHTDDARTGALSEATFDSDLHHALGASALGKHHALVFTADAGDLAHHVFLVVDANGVAGYQAHDDLVIEITGAAHLSLLSTATFD
jgi:Ca2+-binding RTX toxin-like protein